MFERRLKIFMIVIFVFGAVLLGRIFGVQVVHRGYWTKQAAGLLTKLQITETTRGGIYDVRGKPMAVDSACTDACVDYRAIVELPDPKWVHEVALARLTTRLGAEYRSVKSDKRAELVKQETAQVQADIKEMWGVLANLNPEISGETRAHAADDAMNDIRKAIVQSVQMRRQWLGNRNEKRDQTNTENSGWLKFLSGSNGSSTDNLGTIAEETQAHVVLAALDPATHNFLGKRLEKYPGLSLRESTHRVYPMKDVLCQAMGRLSHVSAADLAQGKKDNLDETREYLPNDLVGREGIEALCEPILRGSRGRIETRISDGTVVTNQNFVPGGDVHLSIDSDLQKFAQELLQHVVESDGKGGTFTPPQGVSMHGAVVILDIKTNALRVLASNPGFDVNDLQTRYPALAGDVIEQPLLNRATADPCEPGSTVKPMVGIGAITQGTVLPTDTVNCTGVLMLPGLGRDKSMKHVDGSARCWILSEQLERVRAWQEQNHTTAVPSFAMHHDLNFPEAIERSCDVYFETIADRLGPEGINHWYEQFGFGRTTGIGIFERPGIRPELWKGTPLKRADYCLTGMGQGKVLATPLQIANEAATIARGGIWMRPTLLTPESQATLNAIHPSMVPDSVDLHLSPVALAAAKQGMINVVDGPAGSGRFSHPNYTVAAKTGTAETGPPYIRVKGPSGQMESLKLQPVARNGPEGQTPWFRASGQGEIVHGWFMGYAPVEDPQIAFCVLIQYSGAGGNVSAGPIARQMLEACVRAGYLRTRDSAN